MNYMLTPPSLTGETLTIGSGFCALCAIFFLIWRIQGKSPEEPDWFSFLMESPLANHQSNRKTISANNLPVKEDKSGDFRAVSVVRQGGHVPILDTVLISTVLESGPMSTFQHGVGNPIRGLLQRLATYHIRGTKVSEFRNHPCRLDMMIGRYLRPKAASRLKSLSKHHWSQIETMWQAVGQTVLINADFQPNLVDFELISACQSFKLWYLNTLLSQEDLQSSISHMGKDLKCLASWVQYVCMQNEDNPRPREISRWPGYKPGLKPQMPWFAGHLRHLCDLNGRKDDRTVTKLCQIRTFGRALPCPTRLDVVEGLQETLSVLTTDRTVDSRTLSDIPIAMRYLSDRLDFPKLPCDTHVSVSISGTLAHTQEEGGLASSAREYLEPFKADCLTFYLEGCGPFGADRFFPQKNLSHSDLRHRQAMYDCYGNMILGFQKYSDPMGRFNIPAYDLFFGKPKDTAGIRAVRRENPELSTYYGNNTGYLLLWAASADLMNYGSFYPPPEGFICSSLGHKYPLWWTKKPIRFLPTKPVECRVVALGEPGFKVRPLTAGHPALILVQKAMRQMTQSLLERDGRCRIGLSVTNKLWAFLKFWGRRELTEEVFSQNSDYKSATDYIPLDVIRTIWSSFESFLPIDHPFRVFSPLLWAPRKLLVNRKQYPELSQDCYDHKCGSFMGEPMSYMTLTVMNLLVEYISHTYWKVGRPLWSGLPDSANFSDMDHFVVVGDDKIALRQSRERASLSRQASIGLGFVMSQKDGDSSRLILLCEDHILIGKDRDKKVLIYIDTIKGRLLTNVNRGHADNRASIFGKGRMLTNQLDYLEGSFRQHVMTCYMDLFVRSYGRNFLQIQVPWFLPPNCGGIGLEPVRIPEWGYKYINYIMSILDIEDRSARFAIIWRLRRISQRLQHGAEPTHIAAEKAAESLRGLRMATNETPFDSKGFIFTTKMIFSKMEEDGVIKAPWESFYSFDSITSYAHSKGLCQITKVIEQFERIDTFQQMLEKPVKINRKTLFKWVRRAGRFFDKLRLVDEPLRPDFKSIKDLETRIDRAEDGFVSSETISDILEFGPSLRVHLGEKPKTIAFVNRMELLSQKLFKGTAVPNKLAF
jgi:hypothetical protein